MKFRYLLAALLIAASGPTLAMDVTLGELSLPSFKTFGNSFTAAGEYEDHYSFSISEAASTGGLILEIDLSSLLNIAVTSVSLSNVGTFGGAGFFSFGTLGAGDYVLTVKSLVSGAASLRSSSIFSGLSSVSYSGGLLLTRGTVSAVPEPATLAIYAFGLLAVAYAARRSALPKRVPN